VADDPAPPPPSDPVLRGVLWILVLIVSGTIALGFGIEVGCFYQIEALCTKGAGLKDMMGDILALIALMLGLRKVPPRE
jgi:hypothetical protein